MNDKLKIAALLVVIVVALAFAAIYGRKTFVGGGDTTVGFNKDGTPMTHEQGLEMMRKMRGR